VLRPLSSCTGRHEIEKKRKRKRRLIEGFAKVGQWREDVHAKGRMTAVVLRPLLSCTVRDEIERKSVVGRGGAAGGRVREGRTGSVAANVVLRC
jgi:hypothetical protein